MRLNCEHSPEFYFGEPCLWCKITASEFDAKLDDLDKKNGLCKMKQTMYFSSSKGILETYTTGFCDALRKIAGAHITSNDGRWIDSDSIIIMPDGSKLQLTSEYHEDTKLYSISVTDQ